METVRDSAISIICGNLVMAGVLLPEEVSNYMLYLNSISDNELAETLARSSLNYKKALEFDAMLRIN